MVGKNSEDQDATKDAKEEEKKDKKTVTNTLFGERVQEDLRKSWHLNVRD